MVLISRHHAILCAGNITYDRLLLPRTAAYVIWPLVLLAATVLNISTTAIIVKTKALRRNMIYQIVISKNVANMAFIVVHTVDDLVTAGGSEKLTCNYLAVLQFFQVATSLNDALSVFMVTALRMRKLKISDKNQIMTKPRTGLKTLFCCVTAWVFSLIISLMPILRREAYTSGIPYIACLFFILSILCIGVLILQQVKQHGKRPFMKTARSLRRTEKLVALSGLLLLFTWLPASTGALLAHYLPPSRSIQKSTQILYGLAVLYPVLDPVILIACTNEMRKTFVRTLHRMSKVSHDPRETNVSTVAVEVDLQQKSKRSRQTVCY